MITEFIHNSVELKNWGWNTSTIGALGILFFTIPESWGGYMQGHAIWKARSGEGVSVRWIAYIWAFFTATIFYGISIQSLAVTLNCIVLGLAYLPATTGLIKFKAGRKEKYHVLLFAGMIPAMAFLPWKEVLYTVFSIATVYAFLQEVLELLREKSSGVLEIRNIAILMVSTTFWLAFAYSTQAPALMIMTPPSLVLLVTIVVLWTRYRRMEHRQAATVGV